MVLAGAAVTIGRFALPEPSATGAMPAPASGEAVGRTRRLITPPRRWGPPPGNLLWTEIGADHSATTMVWIPATEHERAEMERFYEAAMEVDWDRLDVHEV